MPKLKTRPKPKKPPADIPAICAELQSLQRQRAITIKSRNMQANRLQAIIAGTLGYASNMEEKARQKKFVEASTLIKDITDGKAEHPFSGIVRMTMVGIDAFNEMKEKLEKEMKSAANKLPVAEWVEQPEQRGFGLLFLAIVIGETGDLSTYTNPGKVWRRMGCAPWTFDGKTLMGATWRSGKYGKLPAEQWDAFGYSPRRRSIAYLIGEGICKQNGPDSEEMAAKKAAKGVKPNLIQGPYHLRYKEAKAKLRAEHPDEKTYPDLRCHRHGMLLATKLLLKRLWMTWNHNPPQKDGFGNGSD